MGAIWSLAAAVKSAYDGVQGNNDQCKMLNDQVQLIAKSLSKLPPQTQERPEVEESISSLKETLRSAEHLMKEFTNTHWLKKSLNYKSINAKFERLFLELDTILKVCGIGFEVRWLHA